jgi:hypothetical protein
VPPIDPNTLPKDVDVLQKIVVDLCEQLQHESAEKDKYRSLLRELLDAERNRKSEQLSKDQLALFETLWKANHPDEEEEKQEGAEPAAEGNRSRRNRRPRSAADDSRWRGIWFGSEWCTTWRGRKSTATAAAKICTWSARKPANATSSFPR